MNEDEVLRQVRDGDRHRGGFRCLRLFRLEGAAFGALRADVLALAQDRVGSLVASPGHVTNWTGPFGEVRQLSLLNASGRVDDFSSDHDGSIFGKRFHLASSCPSLAAFVGAFPHAVNFRVGILGPRSGLSAHEEHALIRMQDGSVGARLRLHLPIVTTPEAELVLDGDVHHLEEATVYFVNHGCVHEASNGGDRPRIHLNWDVLLTRETYDLLFGDAEVPQGWVRVPQEEWSPEPRERRSVGDYRRLPPLVTPAEAARASLCEVQ